MAAVGIISDVSNELRSQIDLALQSTAEAIFYRSDNGTAEDRISLQPPGEIENDTAASLYLYHLEIDPNRRNQRPLPHRSLPDAFHRPPLPLQLRYLFTPIRDDEEQNQLMLGRVLQHFHDSPYFETVGNRPIGDAHGGASRRLSVKPDQLDLEQLTQLWNAFSTPFRVTLGLWVEVVAIDSAQPPQHRRRVEEMLTAVGARKP